jgi:hypothetical protein
MNKEEERILHGLYYHREIVGEEMIYTASEINWLKNTSIPNGRKWKGEDGRLKSIEIPNEDYLASIAATSAAAKRPLAYLQEKGYITCKNEGHYFRIAVTVAGADLARELDTRGLDVAYRALLEEHQEKLLIDLVEAERRVPRENRQHFYVDDMFGSPGVKLMHDGWKETERSVFQGDIETLERAGFISMSVRTGSPVFYVTQQGFAFYADLMAGKGQPLERVQNVSREYIASASFQRRYPVAYSKWSQAESLLWSSDSEASFTTIGHLAREAMQEFAAVLVECFHPIGVESDPAKTVSRIRSVLNSRSASIGTTTKDFSDALLAYWGTVSDLVQRQEHGGQREKEPLVWSDARRVVFQVAIVMFEIDQALSNSNST